MTAQKLWVGKLAMTRNEFCPECRLVWTIAHAPNENKISHRSWERGLLGMIAC